MSEINRYVIRCVLVVSLLASLAAIGGALFFPSWWKPETLAVCAAALAIFPAVLATWSGQRMVELQEDSTRAFPYPSFDARSRYGILQLRITNYGGGIAKNIYLNWANGFETESGKLVDFLSAKNPLIVLLPQQSVTLFVDGSHDFVKKHGYADFTGTVHFQDASGTHHSHDFHLPTGQFKDSLTFDEEAPMTHHELQKIPKELREIPKVLRDIQATLRLFTDHAEGTKPPDQAG